MGIPLWRPALDEEPAKPPSDDESSQDLEDIQAQAFDLVMGLASNRNNEGTLGDNERFLISGLEYERQRATMGEQLREALGLSGGEQESPISEAEGSPDLGIINAEQSDGDRDRQANQSNVLDMLNRSGVLSRLSREEMQRLVYRAYDSSDNDRREQLLPILEGIMTGFDFLRGPSP